MNKQEFLAMSLSYGLKVNIEYGNGCADTAEVEMTGYDLDQDYVLKPIVRPLSDLTKPIVQANYNDGKLFIPIEEIKIISGCDDVEVSEYGVSIENGYAYGYNLNKAFELFQLLIKWHFDLITEECEKVYVTDEFNPYK